MNYLTHPLRPDAFTAPSPHYDGAHTALLDSLLGEIEAGRAGHAVLLLAGMLDAALANEHEHNAAGSALCAWRDALRLHPIAQFLAPMAAAEGDHARRRRILALLAQDNVPHEIALGVQRLHAAMAPVGFVRALRARLMLAQQSLTKAWQAGRSIAIIGEGRAEINALCGLDTANITVVADYAELPMRRFDLILAHDLPDDLNQRDMARAGVDLAKHLNPGGTLCLSALAPAHLGLGWQAACLGRAPMCHEEAGLAAVAGVAGLSITHRRDISNVLIWADMHAPRDGGRP